MDCIFCKIIAGEIPGDKVYEDENVFAFRDINPQAPVHVLIVYHESRIRRYFGGQDCRSEGSYGRIYRCQSERLERFSSEFGRDDAQSVEHLHFHLLGGDKLSESMA